MASAGRPLGYSVTQIALHWIIAALVIVQLVIGEDIVPAYRAFRRGTEPTAQAIFDANIHVYVGIAIFVLACLRVALRIRRGVPEAPAGETVFQRRAAAAAHGLLYLIILGMPVTGALAWYLNIGFMGEIHELGKPVIIVVVVLHAAAALWQHFFAKTDVLVRMLRPSSRRAI